MEVYTVKEIQSILKVGRNVAYALMSSKGFPSYKINERYYVTDESLNKWLHSLEGKEFNV